MIPPGNIHKDQSGGIILKKRWDVPGIPSDQKEQGLMELIGKT
jgi:hypothetical protein